MTFTTLASSSTGNAALVSCGGTHILLDAGISAKQIAAGLRALGTSPQELAAILITHAHSDHVSGLRVMASKAGAPIYATGAAFGEWYKRNRCDEVKSLFHPLEVGSGVQIGPVWVEPFPTSHDTAGSVGYSITADGKRMVMCTDLGYVSAEVRQAVEGCDLRAGAAMVIAGLAAQGVTEIDGVHHIERGYETIVKKLAAVGADIRIVHTPGGEDRAQVG